MIPLEWVIVLLGVSFLCGAGTHWLVTTFYFKPKKVKSPPRELTPTEKFIMDVYMQRARRGLSPFYFEGKPIDPPQDDTLDTSR